MPAPITTWREHLLEAAKGAQLSGESEGRLVGEFVLDLLDECASKELINASLDNIMEWAEALKRVPE